MALAHTAVLVRITFSSVEAEVFITDLEFTRARTVIPVLASRAQSRETIVKNL